MNKIKITLLYTFFLLTKTNAQVREVLDAIKPTKAYDGVAILKKGNGVLQVGVGLGTNLISILNQTGLASILNATTTNKNTGPIGISYEYLVKDNIGISIGLSYAETKQTLTTESVVFGIPIGNASTVYKNASNTSIIASTTYHLFTTDKLDPYTKVSIGINIWKVSFKKQDGTNLPLPTTPTPLAYNAVVGLRYFASSKMGFFGEASYSNLKFAANAGIVFKVH